MKHLIIAFMVLGFVAGCGGERQKYQITQAQEQYYKVKLCAQDLYPEKDVMGITAPNLQIVEESEVDCGGFKRAACYVGATETIVIPRKTDINTFSHELCHHIEKKVNGDPDGDHASKCYLKCGGLMILNDTE